MIPLVPIVSAILRLAEAVVDRIPEPDPELRRLRVEARLRRREMRLQARLARRGVNG